MHRHHQTRQAFGLTIGAPALHENAFWNSGMFTTTPLMRYLPGECGSVMACWRRLSGRSFSQAHCAKPTKKRWSGVRPSRSEEHTSELQSHSFISYAGLRLKKTKSLRWPQVPRVLGPNDDAPSAVAAA